MEHLILYSQAFEDENGMELSIQYGGSDSEDDDDYPPQGSLSRQPVECDNDDITLQELVPPSFPLPTPVPVPGPSSVTDTCTSSTLPSSSADPSSSTAPSTSSADPAQADKRGRKRRRAVSPETLLADSRRMRVDTDNYQEFLASLPIETQDILIRAAVVGLDRSDDRPHVINRRHAVSLEYPVPHEVISRSFHLK